MYLRDFPFMIEYIQKLNFETTNPLDNYIN